MRAVLVATACALLSAAGCTPAAKDERLARVPVSDQLRPALEASRRSLRSGDAGVDSIRRDLDRYHALMERLDRRDTRAAAGDSLYALWSADVANPLWPELADLARGQLGDPRRFEALFERPGFPDTSTALGAYLAEWRASGPRPDGSGFRRAWQRRAEAGAWPGVWFTLGMARWLRYEGSADEAARLAIEALPDARRLGGWRLELETWLQVERALKYADHQDDALHAAVMAEDLARALARRTGNRYLVALAMLERADVLAARRELSPAMALYEACADSAARSGLTVLASECLNHAGTLARRFQQHEAGLALCRRGLALALADHDSLTVPRHLVNISERHMLLGQLDSCRVYLDEAARWIAAYPHPANVARFPLYEAGYSARVGDFARVDSLLAVAAGRRSDFSSVHELAELHLQIIEDGAEGGRPALAYRSIAALDALRDRLGNSFGDRNEAFDLDLATARFLTQQGLFGRAAEALDRAGRALQRKPDPGRAWELSRARGELAQARGDARAAEAAYREALSLAGTRGDEDRVASSRLWLASAMLDEGRFDEAIAQTTVDTAAAFGGRFRTRLAGLLLAAMAESRRGRFEPALATLERARALARPASPPDLLVRLDLETGRAHAGLGRRDEASAAYTSARRRLEGERRQWPAGDARFVDHDVRRELVEGVLALAVGDGRAAPRGEDASRLLTETAALLPAWGRDAVGARARLVEPQVVYFVGREASFRWTAAAGELTLTRLPGERGILAAMAPVVADMQQPGRRPVEAEVAALAAVLGGFDRGWPEGATLTIVPDGPLFAVPWAALPQPGAAGRDWLDRGPIVLAQAPRTRGARQDVATRAPLRLLALGVDGSARGRDAGLPSLRHAEREAREVCALWPAGRATLRVGAAADRAAFTGHELSAFDVIHVSSHVLVYRSFADSTSLLLAGAGDAPLTAAEIGRLGLHARLVYLSACEAAEGVRRAAGPGHAGLVRSFLAAGAERVLAPSTRIDDEAARHFAARFYRHWLGGASVEAALRRAQLDTRGADPGRVRLADWAFYQVNEP